MGCISKSLEILQMQHEIRAANILKKLGYFRKTHKELQMKYQEQKIWCQSQVSSINLPGAKDQP